MKGCPLNDSKTACLLNACNASAGGQSTPSRASIEAAYGAPHSTADILNGKVAPPEAFNDVIQALIQIEQVAIRWDRASVNPNQRLPCMLRKFWYLNSAVTRCCMRPAW